ncbi:MAG: phytanoyl-CoA dioxygenase family protein [Pseudomonadota bacterium]
MNAPLPRVSGPLSAGEVAAFHRDGYIVVRRLFQPDTAARFAAWAEELAARPEEPGRQMMYFEASRTQPGRRLLSRIENFCPFHPGFDALLTGPGLREAVGQLYGEPAMMFKDKINFKLPGGDGFTPHQDVQAGWDAYASLHITALVSIDAATRDNGCLEMVAGRHREGLLGPKWAPLPEAVVAEMKFVPCETAPGDVVLFDSFTPHRSHPNRSSRRRRVLYVTYNRRAEGDQRARYYADKRASYPPDCERDPGKQYVFRV